MSEIIFPNNPHNGYEFVVGKVTYIWDGTKWVSDGPSAAGSGATGATGPQGATGAFEANGNIVAGFVTAGIVTAEYHYGGFIGTFYNETGNPILRSEDASFGGTVYGDIYCGTSGFSTFKDMNASGVLTASHIDARQGLGIITTNYLYGGFIGTIYNETGNPILRSADESFGGTVYGNVFSNLNSGISSFKDVTAAGVITASEFHGDGSNLTGIATQSGATGATGPTGSDGLGAMCFTFRYSNSTNTAINPGTGRISFNNSDPEYATEIAVSEFNSDFVDVANFFSLAGSGSRVYIQEERDSTSFILLTLNSGGVDRGTFRTFSDFTVELHGNVTFSISSKLMVCTQPQGPTGATGPTGLVGNRIKGIVAASADFIDFQTRMAAENFDNL